MRVEKANKRNLTAEVGNVREYARPHVLGGERPGDDDAAVPQVGRGRARPTKRSKTTPSRWPKALAERKGHFFATMPSGQAGLWKRQGTSSLPIFPVYLFTRRRAKLRASWPMLNHVEAAVARGWGPATVQALERALASARRKAIRMTAANMAKATI